MPNFNASQFAPSMGFLKNLGDIGSTLGRPFTPDFSGLNASQKSWGMMPSMLLGSGRLLDPSSMPGAAEVANPVRANAMTQQAGNWFQNQQGVSDFLFNNAMSRDQILQMLQQLRTLQQSADTSGTSGVLGAIF